MIMTQNSEILMPRPRYVFVLLYVNVVMLHVFLEFGLGRAHAHFTRNVKVKTFMHEFFRDAVRNFTIFSRISPKMHQFFRDLKKNRVIDGATHLSKIN